MLRRGAECAQRVGCRVFEGHVFFELRNVRVFSLNSVFGHVAYFFFFFCTSFSLFVSLRTMISHSSSS
jgi:hypothetical protein